MELSGASDGMRLTTRARSGCDPEADERQLSVTFRLQSDSEDQASAISTMGGEMRALLVAAFAAASSMAVAQQQPAQGGRNNGAVDASVLHNAMARTGNSFRGRWKPPEPDCRTKGLQGAAWRTCTCTNIHRGRATQDTYSRYAQFCFGNIWTGPVPTANRR
jgi:hypothetical protein